MMNVHFEKHHCEVLIDELAPLTWLSSGLDQCAAWFFGRGCFALSMVRHLLPGETFMGVVVVPLSPGTAVGPLLWSGVTTVDTLTQEHLLPARLVHPWTDLQTEATVVQFYDLKPEATLGLLAYGLADVACDLFKRGAEVIECQYSLARVQLKGDVGLDAADFANFANPSGTNYEPGDHVGALPWRKPRETKLPL